MGSESAGFEEYSVDVVGEVAESQGQAAQVLEAAVHGFGESVAGAGLFEVGQDVLGPALEGAAQLAELDQLLGDTGGEGVDDGLRLLVAGGPVGVSVGGDEALVDAQLPPIRACTSPSPISIGKVMSTLKGGRAGY